MNLLAAFIFFTRLPFWRLKEVPSECFKHVVPYWPWVGWLTGGLMAMVLGLGSQVMPLSLAWILAIVTRLLVTGALHEDGLADFFDGFGLPIADVQSMEDAVNAAYQMAKKGETVLLSPCCASFDLFKSYEDRGEQFKKCVRNL